MTIHKANEGIEAMRDELLHLETIGRLPRVDYKTGNPDFTAVMSGRCAIKDRLDADFRQQYDSLVKDRFTYEEKLELMRWFPVTSLMTKAQESKYLEAVQAHWAKRGVQLNFPDQAARAA